MSDILENIFDELFPERIPGEYVGIGDKQDKGPVGLGRLLRSASEKRAFGILGPRTFPVPVRRHIKVDGERVGHFDILNDNLLRPHPDGYPARRRNDLVKGNPSPEVPDVEAVFLHPDLNLILGLRRTPVQHQGENTLQQGVDSVIRIGAVAQLLDVHLRPLQDMLIPLKHLNAFRIKPILCVGITLPLREFVILFHTLKNYDIYDHKFKKFSGTSTQGADNYCSGLENYGKKAKFVGNNAKPAGEDK